MKDTTYPNIESVIPTTRLPEDKQDIATLYRLSNIIHSVSDVNELLESIISLAISHLNAERGVIFLINQNGGLNPVVARSLYPDELVDATKVANSIINETIGKQEGIVSNDLQSDPRFDSESAVHYNILSVLCVPLFSANRLIGALYVDHGKKKAAFSERDYLFFSAFANLVGTSIENAQVRENFRIENTYLRQMVASTSGFEEITSNSQRMLTILETVELVANSNASVLITGESGTGKELISKAIHLKSERREKKFIIQNCAAIPETLLESELFGYKKGAFTGAIQDKSGVFEVANEGTLFLDEIGDLSITSQAKILRALQEGEIRRIGDNKPIKVDVRFISATNKNLQELIQKNLFREDLFYRLNVVSISMPPLREREEDIPILCRHFLNFFATRLGKKINDFTKEAMEMLCEYPWPGNVRQVKNEMERIAIIAEEENISSKYLSEAIIQHGFMINQERGSRLKDNLDAVQKKMLVEALVRYNWNKSKAADDLGISRRGLIKMVERFELDRRKRKRHLY